MVYEAKLTYESRLRNVQFLQVFTSCFRMTSARLDLVIFGATGFTGKVAVAQILKLIKEQNFSWGVAGRSASKLKEVLSNVSSKTGA